MITKCSIFKTAVFTAAFLSAFWAQAQLVELGAVQHQKIASSSIPKAGLRLHTTNSLPFWDDFSQGLDTLKWTIAGASYTETIGLSAPSVGMVLLDGVDQNGTPYSLTQIDQGETDSLTSAPFDLSGLSDQESETLYLSFFWQAGGRAELPDENDQLTLQVKDPEGNWISIWTQFGGVALDRENFKQEIVRILPIWQSEDFQFRFFANGRQSGPFDSWLIDYVYLNSNRSEADLFYLDRSLTQPNRLRLGDFAAYPLALLENNQEEMWGSISNEFNNLENRFRSMEYSMSITDPSSQTFTPINSNTPFNPVPNALERRSFESLEFTEIPVPAKATSLQIRTFLTSGDGPLFSVEEQDTSFYAGVNFAQNDTVVSEFKLMDFFAYDRGQADYAAGINQRSGQLAIKYETPEEVYIKGISIEFTNPRQANQAVDIQVWKELDQDPIFIREELIPEFDPDQSYAYYSLDTNLSVNGAFYIGFTQYSNDFIHVGLDKTNEQGDKLYYNVVGEWVQNEEVNGALMIRPHVSLQPEFEETENPEEPLSIYPNPVESYLNIEGVFSEIRVFDSFGREIFLEHQLSDKGEIVNFNGQRPGIYVLNLTTEKGMKSYRILVQ
ncbi:T9SS type A sorting domain-containing protein [Algoriphagus halophytocola]|uniref:T9SS type A sorting domain-containing protein n=1 Tax=Algoriphagus halophytocola TaxID=2991499 RepID=A0ABY6MHG0_9BACT|nr:MULTISPECIES: T9SS type A sorting domain-containing protein [unclassified Algoriphagus]UZD23226.1 T9SS type A sorting domain-containing protein [Algoriphagus sp. TR-M5]WBL44519.1 T9SS type A sorting domain-containing protein [Algoriphagus sp. TR-M9]